MIGSHGSRRDTELGQRFVENETLDGRCGPHGPSLDARHIESTPLPWTEMLPPWLLFEFQAENGQPVRLCDFASAGQAGTPYRSWLDLSHTPEPRVYSPDQPLRTLPL